MTSEIRLARAAALAATITAIQHATLYDTTLPREARYALGVGAILTGFAAWAVPARRLDALAALCIVSAAAAAPVVAGYAWRRVRLEVRYGRLAGW